MNSIVGFILTVYDLVGKEVAFNRELLPNGYKVDVSKWDGGIYFLKVGSWVYKLIVNH